MPPKERLWDEPMKMTSGEAPSVHKVMVATDLSETANRAVRWAANVAASQQAELLLFQVLPAAEGDGTEVVSTPEDTLEKAKEKLKQFAEELVGPRGRARVVVDDDPAQAILDAIEEERVDMIVVGNVGMSGRKQFLLGNIPNRISHNARCAVVIVNTAPPDRKGVSGHPRGVSDASDYVEGRLLSRAWRIGPTFAKLGQILSTRPDLLPPAFMAELETLQERVTPLTEAEVVSVMEQELGVPWEDVFESIDPEPLAAGTIAQVHRARLESGDRVVVKVQRPTAERDILQDLGLLEMFAQKAADRPALRQVFDVPAIVEHLSSSLRRELDFRHEAANIRRMQEVIKPFSRLDVPSVYEEYSTSRLLVMQEIQGMPVREAPNGLARKEAARQLLESYYHQVMVEGFFHADPHPGNMKWWNDKIYFLDLGMAGEVDAELRELILLILLAFSERDAAFLSEVVLLLADGDGRDDAVDFAAFREDIEHLIAQYRDLSLRELRLGPILQEVTEISVRRNVRVPASLTLTGKAFGQMQMAAAELDPDLDLFSVAESFVLKNTLRQLAGGLDPKKIFYETQKARVRLGRLLEAVEGAVGARPGARLQVDFRGTEPLEDTINRASRRLSFALGLGGTLVATAISANSTQVPRWVPATMGSIGSALAAGLVIDRSRRQE
jgi:predicted unusual protein kinase regulating ubiquinone biosynthesis (AarF/ABC1/UbiB family)/nucleotide-binding universal stress UspA family protein